MRIRNALATLPGLCFVVCAHAEEPIAPGKFLGEQGQWRLHTSAVYSNSESSTVKSGDYVLVQTGTGEYVQVPSTLAKQNSNTDALLIIPGISYGLADGTELGANLSARSIWARSETADGQQSDHATQFSSASFNVSHTFTKSRKVLIVVGALNANLAQNVAATGTDLGYGKSLSAGAVVYRLIEPVVLSANAFYQVNRSRSVGGVTRTPGNVLALSPSVYFKANLFVTFFGGLNWSLQQGSQTEGQARRLSHTQTGLDFGLGYAWSEDVKLVVTANTNISGGSGTSIVLTASYYLRNDSTAVK